MKRKILRWWYKLQIVEGSILTHRIKGKFRVKYKDGQISQPFSYKVAKDYSEIFGGEVIDNF